jgi:hypothetical protein
MSSVTIAGDTSGSIILAAPAVAGSTTLTLPSTSGTVLTTSSSIAGNGPAFSVYTNDSSAYFINANAIKVRFNVEEFDTNSCYDTSNYRFTPNVAGYYQFTAKILGAWGPGQQMLTYIRKNGGSEKEVQQAYLNQNAESYAASAMFYLNGTTDYVEVYVYQSIAGTSSVYTGSSQTFFQGFMVRGA